ncbi:glycosyltransferase family 4 protein [Actinomyces minihominis]|uniref:glycosyltransferase family 4 protein n=1 Tax=Actinomyces minihominis TaxID=2002838 RepID=UPI000C081DF8|nr:glycosyltransferase family 4 protein [Actinomyces minihominis]
MSSKLGNVLRRSPLIATVVARMVSEDPLLFGVQTLRKLPWPLRRSVAQLLPSTSSRRDLTALRYFILDQRSEAARLLLSDNRSKQKTSISTRLGQELLIQLGYTPEDILDSRTALRSAWGAGDLEKLKSLEAPGRVGQRYTGEQMILRPGWGISLPKTPVAPRQTNNNDARPTRALHILTNSLPWTRSGYTYRTQNILRFLQKAGVEVLGVTRLGYPTTIGGLWANEVDVVDGVTYQRLLPSMWPQDPAARLVKQAQMLLPIVQQFQPDILHTTTNYQNALVTDAVSRATGIPWIYEMRGNMEQTWVARQPSELQVQAKESDRYRLMKLRETEMAMRANAVITLSNIQRHDLIERGVPAEKIFIVPNSVDEALLEVPRDVKAARKRLGLDPHGFWVGSVTSVVDYEGLPTLIRATKIARDQGLDVRCAIVGDGVALPELRVLVTELELDDYVVLPGRVPPDDAKRWYQALDLFVIPRNDTEVTRIVTPIKGLEAQALGVPVAVSDLPALREVSAREDLVFPAGDSQCLVKLIGTVQSNDSAPPTTVSTEQSFASARSWSSSVKKICETYAEVTRFE